MLWMKGNQQMVDRTIIQGRCWCFMVTGGKVSASHWNHSMKVNQSIIEAGYRPLKNPHHTAFLMYYGEWTLRTASRLKACKYEMWYIYLEMFLLVPYSADMNAAPVDCRKHLIGKIKGMAEWWEFLLLCPLFFLSFKSRSTLYFNGQP